jgi:hypothetical protein
MKLEILFFKENWFKKSFNRTLKYSKFQISNFKG